MLDKNVKINVEAIKFSLRGSSDVDIKTINLLGDDIAPRTQPCTSLTGW